MLLLGELIDHFDIYKFETTKIVSEIARLAPVGITVLDAGSGDQRYKPFFSSQKYISADFIKVDKVYKSPDIECDLESIPLADKPVDLILCTWVFEHLREPEKVLLEFKRILKPGGSIHITAPQNHIEHEVPYDYLRYTKYWFEYMGEKLFFSNTRATPIGSYFHMLAHVLFLLPQILITRNSSIFSRVFRYLIYIPVLIFAEIIKYLSFLDTQKRFVLGYYIKYVD